MIIIMKTNDRQTYAHVCIFTSNTNIHHWHCNLCTLNNKHIQSNSETISDVTCRTDNLRYQSKQAENVYKGICLVKTSLMGELEHHRVNRWYRVRLSFLIEFHSLYKCAIVLVLKVCRLYNIQSKDLAGWSSKPTTCIPRRWLSSRWFH